MLNIIILPTDTSCVFAHFYSIVNMTCTAIKTCFLEVFFHKLSQETQIQVLCEVSVKV